MYKTKKMSEDVHTTLQGTLGLLEGLQNSPDDSLYTNKSHVNLLKSINSLLGRGDEINSDDAERVLRVCLQNKLDMRSAPYTLSIISTLLSIDKEKPFSPSVDFLPSALAVLEILKKCAEDKANCIRTLSFQVLMSHPASTLTNLVRNHSAVLFETFTLFYTLQIGFSDNKTETFILLQLLKVLPANEKSQFVKEGIPLWFNNMLPCLMQILVSVEDREKVETCLSNAELLTEQLILHDYFDYPEWQQFLINIVDSKKFPVCIRTVLDKGKDTWYRIWILCIKLMKSRVTNSFGPYGTPINSLLPVVEAAFKMNSTQRVRAFACWNELIRNFSNEINANCIGKRIKLVVIPLRLNNAKTEDAAVAKFNTWWLLIRRFKPILEKFTNEILIPFLHFLFGKRQYTKQSFWAGQLSNNMRQKCLEAFVEIVGHSDYDGCTTSIEPLNGKVITTVMLADHWNDWLFSLKTAVSVVAMNNTPAARKKLRCLWKSFVLLMTELLDNSVRRDWLNDIVHLLSVLAEESDIYIALVEIIMEDLTLPLYGDPNILTLLNSKSQAHRPMHEIVVITTGKTFDSFYKRYDPDELQRMLESLVTALLMESTTTPVYMIWLLDDLPMTDSSFKLWTALARKATESNLCLQVLKALLRWPLKAVLAVNDVKDAALAWYTLYNTVHVKLDKIGFDNEISKLLTKPVEDSKAANYFVLYALIGVLKYKPNEDKMAKLEALTYEMNAYEEFEQLIPALVDTLAFMIDNSSMYEDLGPITINCINNVLKVINSNTKSNKNNPSISRETAFSEARTKIPSINKTVLTDTITTAMKNFLAKSSNDALKKEVTNVISSLENSDDKSDTKSPKKTETVPKEFASPKLQNLKKNKKKEPSIVNTVMENGEEYVVVKSHWKFNPKNLTENQKEKLQRKRDIPALYQDLSQSQDEFKLTAWKTDSNSQDTSLSSSKSSKSTSNKDASEVLKNMPSSDVVPKIMENILDNAKNTQQKSNVTSPATIDKVPKADKVTTQGTKSPRMALKDRVFRNVRNLIEKSSPSHSEIKNKDLNVLDNASITPLFKPSNEITENKNSSNQIEVPKSPVSKLVTEDNDAVNKQENQSPTANKPPEHIMNKVIVVTAKQNKQNITLVCTPISKTKKDNNITNSASLLSTERPARMKRKPKKFDDSLLLAFKKGRHSNTESEDSQDSQDVQPEITVAQVHTPKHKNDKTEIDLITKLIKDDNIETINTTKKVNESKTRKTDDVIVLSADIITDCDALKHKEIVESHNTDNVLVTPMTPISNKTNEKSPEKPKTSVEVPTDKDKASEGIENDSAIKLFEENKQVLPTIKTPSNKLKEVILQKSSMKRKLQQDKQAEIITTPLIKTRKAKLRIENIINAASMTPVTTVVDKSKDIDKDKIFTNTTDVEMETIKGDSQDVVFTPVKKTCKSKDGQQKSTKKSVAQKETIEQDSQLESVTLTEKPEDVNTPIPAVKSKKATKDNESKSDDKVSVAPSIKHKDSDPKSCMKKAKKSRIETELMIDTVEGHPFLKSQSEKRITRKKIMEAENSGRRKSLAEKLNKLKLEATPKTSKKPKEKKASPTNSITVEESQDKQNISQDVLMDEPPCSEDVIESSQDSTMTTISIKSTKRTPKRQPVASLGGVVKGTTETQELMQESQVNVLNNKTHEKTMTTNSEKSTKLTPTKRQSAVSHERVVKETTETQELMQESEVNVPYNETLEETMATSSEKLTSPKRHPVVSLKRVEIETAETQERLQESEVNVPNTETLDKIMATSSKKSTKLTSPKLHPVVSLERVDIETAETQEEGMQESEVNVPNNETLDKIMATSSEKSTKLTSPKLHPVVSLERVDIETAETQDERMQETEVNVPSNKTPEKTMTTSSEKSTKLTSPKRQPVVSLEKVDIKKTETQERMQESEVNVPSNQTPKKTMTTCSEKSTKLTSPKLHPVVSLERVGIETAETQELMQESKVNVSNNITVEKTMTTSSVKSTKLTSPKRQPVVSLEKVDIERTETQERMQESEVNVSNNITVEKTMTTSSVKSTKLTSPKRQPVVSLEKVNIKRTETQEIMQESEVNVPKNESLEKTMTISSVKSTKLTSPKLQPVVSLKRVDIESPQKTQNLLQDCEMNVPNNETLDKTDIELPQNKTAEVDKNATDLTENMDTEPMDDKDSSDDVVILDETEPSPITINSEPVIGPETQELAEADTQPNDPEQFANIEEFSIVSKRQPHLAIIENESVEVTNINIDDTNDVSSPYKDDIVRKQDFLNNTLEISPIKVQSPDREKKSPSPETSNDFVVIKLSSPVHSNGEPFEKHNSPEFFSEDKVSPDKRDASPPRAEITVTNTSPSSSLSLKKNRPQVRPTGRAAQMLDLLCVNSDLKVTKINERVEAEETKKASVSTPARRNLRILYNSVGDSEMPEQNVEEVDNFLKLKRTLPTVTSSPSGPILKRKLIDIADEATASPASKRKRVSFHDPPVSTTVSVHKYIEPLSMVRSPQSSAKKRLERQTRAGLKSPKRLENAFNLDSVLSKTVESFTETTPTDDTQNTSLNVTPVVEIVKTSELNDTDPFYPDLIDCKEPIQVIATELSSPAMSELFVKELEGKVETIGDLAKMTELEINRLCIKAPKIQVAKKVLTDYATKLPAMELVETVIEEAFSEPMTESLLDKTVSVEMQTDAVEISSSEIQTDIAAVILASTQTENIVTAHTSMQTDESNTDDIISTCLTEKEDFVEKLTEKLDEGLIKTIAGKLPPKSLFDLLIKKSVDSTNVCNRLLKLHSKGLPKENKSCAELSFVKDVLTKRYESRDLVLFCSQLLQKIHDMTEEPA